MKKLELFTARDFAGSTEMIDSVTWEDAALIANQKLHSWLRDNSVRVYGSRDKMEWLQAKNTIGGRGVVMGDFKESYYQALLIQIEEVPKPCEHKPSLDWRIADGIMHKYCTDCNAKLRPTGWTEVKE